MKIKVINDSASGDSKWFNGKLNEEFDVIGNISKEDYYIVEGGIITNKTIPKENCVKLM